MRAYPEMCVVSHYTCIFHCFCWMYFIEKRRTFFAISVKMRLPFAAVVSVQIGKSLSRVVVERALKN